jgi:predicted phage tail component-like protein
MTAVVSASEFGFTFASVHSRDFNLRVVEIHRNISPGLSESVQNVPGKLGDIYQGTDIQSAVYAIDVKLIADSHEQRVALIHQISQWLAPLSDGEFPLIFDDEPDYTYYAHVQSTGELTRSLYNGTGTITFSCSDPRGFGEQVSLAATNNPATLEIDGVDQTYPILTCVPHKDVTKIAVTDQNGNYAYVGADVDPEIPTAPVDKEPLVFWDQCQSLNPWAEVTDPSFNIENGQIGDGSSMVTTGESIKIGTDENGHADFGTDVTGKWYGACREQTLSSPLSDFRIRVRFYNNQYYARSMGKCELYLLDQNGARIGKIMLKDNGNSEAVYAQAQLGYSSDGTHQEIYYGQGQVDYRGTDQKTIKVNGGTVTVKKKGKSTTKQVWKTIKRTEDLSTGTFTNFYGYIEIEKIGQVFTARIMKFDDNSNPVWSKPIEAVFTDSGGQYQRQLGGIAFYTAKYKITEDGTNPRVYYTNNGMGLCDVKIWEIIDGGNKPQVVNNVPVIIAHANEEIKINSETRTVYKNGGIFMQYLYPGSTFLKIQGGVPTTLSFEPSLDDADWFLDFRPTRR